jgi:hypothetical protein
MRARSHAVAAAQGHKGHRGLQVGTVLLGCLAVAWTGAAMAQAPVVDQAVNPAPGLAVPRAVPRTIALGLPMTDLFGAANRLETPPLDLAALLAEDAANVEGPLRIGVVQDFAPQSAEAGQWTNLPDGGHLWTMSFSAPGAAALRLRVRPWNPPPGAELILFNARSPEESIGPFTSSYPIRQEEFWSAIVYSDGVNLEYYLPPDADPRDPRSAIMVDGLLHQYRDPLVTQLRELSCHLDLLCYPDWVAAGNGVAAIASIVSPYGYFCSGGMLNRIPGDYTALFATANHCGVSVSNESSVIVTWFYQTAVCDGTPPSPSTLPQTLGCAALVNDASTDYSLIGLQDDVPADVTYLAWDAGHWSNGSSATMIHHPRGTYKRITFGTKTADVTSCIPAAAWQIYVANGDGEDEPGSSGAPMFDSDHRVRGTASCATWSCTSADIIEAGRFDLAYEKLAPYLAPADPVYVNGGYTGVEQGTLAQPFQRFKRGSFGVIRGHDLHVEAGSYNESLVIDRAMTIHARNGTVVIGQ